MDQVTKHAAAGAIREYRTICERVLQSVSEIRNKVLEPKLVIETAEAGRVRQIFVTEDAQPEDKVMLNRAVVEGLRTGAEILGFAGPNLPGFGSIAAVLRY